MEQCQCSLLWESSGGGVLVKGSYPQDKLKLRKRISSPNVLESLLHTPSHPIPKDKRRHFIHISLIILLIIGKEPWQSLIRTGGLLFLSEISHQWSVTQVQLHWPQGTMLLDKNDSIKFCLLSLRHSLKTKQNKAKLQLFSSCLLKPCSIWRWAIKVMCSHPGAWGHGPQ